MSMNTTPRQTSHLKREILVRLIRAYLSEDFAENKALQKEKEVIVRQAVLSLPDVQRDVIILRFYHDLKIKEIASIQKVPIPTVKTRLRRALRELKECELW